ncbi:MAG: globin domain-containing protein, partial [Burkholderiales bacterium]
KHAGYGVAHDDYDTVGTALLRTLQQRIGASFTGEVCEAWTGAYAALAGSMQEGARTALMQAA